MYLFKRFRMDESCSGAEWAQLPPLHAVNPKEIYCARRTTLVLPVEGAPLVFSSDYAHDVSLRLTAADGKTIELPAAANALQGGYVLDTSGVSSAQYARSRLGACCRRGRGFARWTPGYRPLSRRRCQLY